MLSLDINSLHTPKSFQIANPKVVMYCGDVNIIRKVDRECPRWSYDSQSPPQSKASLQEAVVWLGRGSCIPIGLDRLEGDAVKV